MKWISTIHRAYRLSIAAIMASTLMCPLLVTSNNPSYEEQLHEIYTQFYSHKVSPEEWQGAVSNRPSDTYTIQKNDTLWDISRVVFNDPHFWPKLWSVNPNINNPHLIQPNDILGFMHGTENSPPAFTVIKQKNGFKANPAPPKLPPELLKKIKNIKIPPVKKIQPVLNELPSSLPFINLMQSNDPTAPILHKPSEGYKIDAISNLTSYVSDSKIDSDGEIISTKRYGQYSFNYGERVILKMKGNIESGQTLRVIKNLGRLSPSTLGVRGPFGHEISIQGEVKVIDKVPRSFNLYEAEVISSFKPISIGAFVQIQRPLTFNFNKTNIFGQSEAQIIGFASDYKYQPQGYPFAITYLNRGSSSDLTVNQMYQIRLNRSVRRGNKYPYDIKIGELKIVHTEGRFATAIITYMTDPVKTGDYIIPIGTNVAQGDYTFLEDNEGYEEESTEDTEELAETPDQMEDIEDIEDAEEFVKTPDQMEDTEELIEDSDDSSMEDAEKPVEKEKADLFRENSKLPEREPTSTSKKNKQLKKTKNDKNTPKKESTSPQKQQRKNTPKSDDLEKEFLEDD